MTQAYKDSYLKRSYDFLIEKEAELIKKICDGKTTFINVFTVYYYLLWNGLLSNKECFNFGPPEHSINLKTGTSIICGEGVCVNIAAHFCDILKHINDNNCAFLVGMHVKENDVWDTTHSAIPKKIANVAVLPSESLLNHANVLIMDEGKIYILDPTNFLIYKGIKNDKDNPTLTRIDLRLSIDLDSTYTDANQLRDAANQLKKLNDVFASREYKRYNNDVLSSVLNSGISMCHNHTKEIIEFRQEYNSVYKYIDLGMSDFSMQIRNKAKKLGTK